jgi:hypothetical protein
VTVDDQVARLGSGAIEGVEAAFVAWMQSGADVPVVTIEFATGLTVPMQPDGVNAIVVGPISIPGHVNDLAVTVGFSDTKTGEIVEADIIINEKYAIDSLPVGVESAAPVANTKHDPSHDRHGKEENDDDHDGDSFDYDREPQAVVPSCTGDPERGLACGGRYDLESIVAHEVGHFYGLGEDKNDGLATMYYCTSQCETHKRSLEPDDTSVMRQVYADGYEDLGEVRCSIGAVGPSRQTPWAAAVLFGSLSLLAGRRRVANRRRKTSREDRQR